MEGQQENSDFVFNAAEKTQYILENYYHLNLEPLFEALADSVMWIGPGNLYVFGAEAVRKLFDKIYMPSIDLSNIEITELYKADETTVVVGQYDAVTNADSDEIAAVHQRITFNWQRTENEWKIIHMHVSNEYNELVDNEVYPVKMSHQTFRYMQHLLNQKLIDSKKIVLKEASDDYFINSDEVVYIESVKNKSLLHCLNKTILTSHSIAELEQLLPSNFCRVHRSYLVNCNCVTKISRFVLELNGVFTIPLPEKRYTAIRDEIRNKISLKTEKYENKQQEM